VRAFTLRSVIAAAAAVVSLLFPALSGAHPDDGVFRLADGFDYGDARDVAMLPDGSVVVAGSKAWLLTPDGRRTEIAGLHGTGIAATADGGVLGILGGNWDHRILRWNPASGVSVVAGTGVSGYAGDGGPAVQALIDLTSPESEDPRGIVSYADGGFAFVDAGNDAIRAVDAAGTIRTVARRRGADLVGLAAMPDGGFMLTEYLAGQVRLLGADGTQLLWNIFDPLDIAVSAAGAAVLSEIDPGELWRRRPGSRIFRPYLRHPRSTDAFDFAARRYVGEGVAFDARGGLLFVSAGRGDVTYVPNGPTPWTLAALRDLRTARRAVTADIEVTQPGVAMLEIVRGKRVVARASRAVTAGHTTLRANGRIARGWHEARLQMQGPGATTASDAVPFHGARALTVALARRLLGPEQGETEESRYRLGRRCQRFGSRRVDCEVRADGQCAGVVSLALGRSGVVMRRHYGCARPRFRRSPAFDPWDGIQRLARGESGTFIVDEAF